MCFIRVNSWIALLGDLTNDPRINTKSENPLACRVIQDTKAH
jgi:hypothetical protein